MGELGLWTIYANYSRSHLSILTATDMDHPCLSSKVKPIILNGRLIMTGRLTTDHLMTDRLTTGHLIMAIGCGRITPR